MAFELLPKHRDLGGFSVKRLLPHPNKRALGPFVFFDHMGPAAFPAGTGIDVRPHPHIGLATVTYLIEGSILHRDSLGNVQEIFPGDINWMTAGRGIVHSERESLEVRAKPHRANGFQIWLALPPDKETVEPEFFHYEKNALPHVMEDGVMMRILVGNAFERDSPAKTYSPTFYVDILANAGRGIDRPHPDMEAGVYIQTGSVGIGDKIFGSGSFVVLEPEDRILSFVEATRLMLLGGQAFDRVPHLEWNFVSSEKSRIEAARKRWREGGFPGIPGDEREYIPLP